MGWTDSGDPIQHTLIAKQLLCCFQVHDDNVIRPLCIPAPHLRLDLQHPNTNLPASAAEVRALEQQLSDNDNNNVMLSSIGRVRAMTVFAFHSDLS